jgi:acid-sensing ion channel, other
MPHEYPPIQTSYFVIPTGESLRIILKPRIITSDTELRHYPVTTRKCYFSNEFRLKYFLKYTKSHCELECEIDQILAECGCLPNIIESKDLNLKFEMDHQILFHLDRDKADICGPFQKLCLESQIDQLRRQNLVACNCMPECSSISFETEVSAFNLNSSTLHNYQEQFVTL